MEQRDDKDQQTTVPPVDLRPVETEDTGSDEPAGHTISPVDFTPPVDEAAAKTRRITPVRGVIIGVFTVLGILAWFMFTAKSVDLMFNVPPDTVEVDGGWLSFEIGGRHLLRRGSYRVTATKEGYEPFETQIIVLGQQNQEFELTLQKLPGLLGVTTGPVTGALVTIDGRRAGVTPLEPVELKPGSHKIVVTAELYLDHESVVEIEGARVRQDIDIALEPAWADVTVTSTPAGAGVFVDGEEVGQTPMIAAVPQGFRRLSLMLDGYKSWEREFEVVAGEQVELPPVTLESAEGLVSLRSSPQGAVVTVNGAYRGRTPLSLELEPGVTHTVVLSKAGHNSATRRINVESQASRNLSVTLEALIGEVTVTSSPEGVSLFVDGRDRGTGNTTLQLTAVPHKLEFRKEGYAPFVTTVTPRPGYPQAITASLKSYAQLREEAIPKVISTKTGYEMRLVRPGRLIMGSPRREQGRRANEVQRNVELTRPFYIGTREITNKEFKAFESSHKSGFEKRVSLDIDDRPVVRVSWEDAILFCNWLSEKEGLEPAYALREGKLTPVRPITDGYRLPTEAEWAWVARYAGGSRPIRYPWGDRMPPTAGSGNYADKSAVAFVRNAIEDYNDTYPVTAPVGSFSPNALGLYDLGGNVSEWIHDYYTESATISTKPELDPAGPEVGENHVVRGSSWMHSKLTELRLTYREGATDGRPDLGFRVVRYLVEPDQVAAK